MEYTKQNFGLVFSNEKDCGDTLFSGSGVSIQSYHLKKDASIMENFENVNPTYGNHLITYLVIKGKLEIRYGEEKLIISAGDCFSINVNRNFTCWAVEECDLFAIHNCVEPDVDTTPQQLVDAVKKVELADGYLKGHNYRVGKYSTLIMQVLSPERSTVNFHIAAAYHDVGKIVVPEEVLNKNERLTPEEFDLIKKHPIASYDMLREIKDEETARFARWHHERIDGSGYPDGLKGDEIPVESRVIAVADVFDALTTDRCYRKSYSFLKAVEILVEEAQKGKLDEKIVKILAHMVETEVIKEGTDNMLKDANSIVDYDGFTLADIRNALSISGSGMWKLESEPGKKHKLYGDEIMNDLIGVPDNISPEERYEIFISRVYPEDLPMFASYAENLRKEQSEIIYRYRNPKYGLIYVRCGGKKDSTVTDKNCYRGFHQNVNDTVRIEQEKRRQLTESAELYRKMSAKIMENFTNAAIYIDSQTGKYQWLNNTDQRLEAYDDYEALCIAHSKYMPEEYAKEFCEKTQITNLNEQLKDSDEYSFSVYAYDNGSELRRITMWYTVVDDSRRYLISVLKDTTEDYIREQQLAKALVAADHANKAKSVFLNNMSHDIRTPMNAIIGFKNLAQKHIDNKDKCLDYLTKIGVSSNHLLSLINDVLDMSRIESGKMNIIEAPGSIIQMMRDVETIFTTGAEEKGIYFKVSVNELKDDFVLCDKLRVNQIMLNCVSNAIKFTQEGGSVEVSVTQLVDEADEISKYQFVIKDTGIGMSREFLDIIFEPFSREESSIAHQIQGTGLGMSICKNLVDLMNGSIKVESEEGKGSCFTIVLPLKRIEGMNNSGEKKTSVSEEISLKGMRVLLVEDNELNREIATEILSEYGIETHYATNGLDAVDNFRAAKEFFFDCILMDIQMPIMNGYDAAKTIRALERPDARAIRIIAMTANAFEEDKQRTIEAGMNDHITKPIDIKRLKEVLYSVYSEKIQY